MAASASYIAAPPAVRLTLPDANPTYSLTAALAGCCDVPLLCLLTEFGFIYMSRKENRKTLTMKKSKIKIMNYSVD
jgi:hypothetical protein